MSDKYVIFDNLSGYFLTDAARAEFGERAEEYQTGTRWDQNSMAGIDLDSFEPSAIFSTAEEAQGIIDALIVEFKTEGMTEDQIDLEIYKVTKRTFVVNEVVEYEGLTYLTY